jgi:DNA repair exonuclease SbcCD ATPase subunit
MNNRTGVLVLALLALGLGIALIFVRVQSSKQSQDFVTSFDTYSNKMAVAVRDLETVTTNLYQERVERQAVLEQLSTRLTTVTNDLSRTRTELIQKSEEVAKRDTRINELVQENQTLDTQKQELSTALTNLNAQIAETRRKLTEANQDKAELGKQLSKLMADKAELERQFNDVTIVRAQLTKLKEEMAVARRIEWTRQGLYTTGDEKGAQHLLQGISGSRTAAKPAPKPGYDLNVEVMSDGSVRVIPPMTNSPSGTKKR